MVATIVVEVTPIAPLSSVTLSCTVHVPGAKEWDTEAPLAVWVSPKSQK